MTSQLDLLREALAQIEEDDRASTQPSITSFVSTPQLVDEGRPKPKPSHRTRLQDAVQKGVKAKKEFELAMTMQALGIHSSKVFPIVVVQEEDGIIHPVPIVPKIPSPEDLKRTESPATYVTNISLRSTLPDEYPHARRHLEVAGKVSLVKPKRVAIICNKHHFIHERTKEAAANLVEHDELYKKLNTKVPLVDPADARKVIEGLAKPLKDVIPSSQEAVSTLFDAGIFAYKLAHKASYDSRIFDLKLDDNGVLGFTGEVMHRRFTLTLNEVLHEAPPGHSAPNEKSQEAAL